MHKKDGIELKKLLGDERRYQLLEMLKNANEPLKGIDLAKKSGVSRQVIVGDMTLLKARNEPILATSRGYVYTTQTISNYAVERQIACSHSPDEARDELYTLVDSGVVVKNVTVEHPVYGELTASIMVANRHEVDLFISRVEETGASYLSELTDGIHLHLIAAPSSEYIDAAINAMRNKGFLADENGE
ncbi:transcription repressor NadR [Paenisporosarcina sp. TG20]|uniref:transcription repressor NadR n=1 Tax=Paenisporosarcina sp. TG20 TaxID=1211706 RepID=UPI00031071AE|nr:transcription repressor NadR [Paenisporosarcina sp. TG20]